MPTKTHFNVTHPDGIVETFPNVSSAAKNLGITAYSVKKHAAQNTYTPSGARIAAEEVEVEGDNTPNVNPDIVVVGLHIRRDLIENARSSLTQAGVNPRKLASILREHTETFLRSYSPTV